MISTLPSCFLSPRRIICESLFVRRPTSPVDFIGRFLHGIDRPIVQFVHFRLFRVIPAQEYLDVFASDRSHMLKEDRITYNSPPPTYPPICTLSNYFSTHCQDLCLSA